MQVGDTVYYVVSSMAVREATLVRLTPAMCTLRYLSGAICLPLSRVYASPEEAAAHVTRHPGAADTAPESRGDQLALREAYDFSGKPLL